jgi:hypothetical protein
MKEEAGMKLWSPTRAFVGLAAAGLVALLGTTANASENIYKNYNGLLSFDPANRPTQPDGNGAGPTLNPGGSGQVLYAGYFDVRSNDGVQINNIQILNQSTNDTSVGDCTEMDYMRGNNGENCYDPIGGILAKVRFRAYKQSAEVLDFNIALSCGEVWAGNLSLDGTTPVVKSQFPVVVRNRAGWGTSSATYSTTSDAIVTAPAFDPNNGGAAQPFLGVTTGAFGVADDQDQQRGYIEIIAIESLFCEPDGEPGTQNEFVPGAGELNLDGGNWTRIDEAPSNNMSGEIFLVKPSVGVSYGYQMDAVTRFSAVDSGSLIPGDIDALIGQETPNAGDCRVAFEGNALSETECRTAMSLAMSKSRVFGQYDIEEVTAGNTNMIVTLLNKHLYCDQIDVPFPPFQCGQYQNDTVKPDGSVIYGATGGEEIGCEVYDRQENFFIPDGPGECGIVSPCTPPTAEYERCYLPYEQTIINISTTQTVGNGADTQFLTGYLPHGRSGWVELDLRTNLEGAVIHTGYDTNQSVLGLPVEGFVGLPATGLVLQTYQNGNAGGTYGNAIPMTSNQQILMIGQSN